MLSILNNYKKDHASHMIGINDQCIKYSTFIIFCECVGTY